MNMLSLVRIAFAMGAITTVAGCGTMDSLMEQRIATTAITGYHPKSFIKSLLGYTDKSIGGNTYSIRVEATRVTPRDRVEAIALLRAVDIAKAENFPVFAVTDRKQEMRCEYFGRSRSNSTLAVAEPVISIEIELLRQEDDAYSESYKIEEIESSLRDRVKDIELTLDERQRIRFGYVAECPSTPSRN